MEHLQVYRVTVVDSVVQIFSVLTGFCVCVYSISYWERWVKISHSDWIYLFFPFSSVSFCFMYFEAMLLAHIHL